VTQSNRIPDCRLEPVTVAQMTVGDAGHIRPWGVMADSKGRAFVDGRCALVDVGGDNLARIWRDCEGLHLDLARVTEKIRRGVEGRPLRVKTVQDQWRGARRDV